MNYDQARELPGGWHWTTMNDGVVQTAQPCITILRPFDPTQAHVPLKSEDIRRCEPHATKEEAEHHFYDWCLHELKEHEWDTAVRCERGCGTWTNKSLGNRGMAGYFKDIFLCDFHRREDVVAEMRPFKPGIEIIHS